MSTIRDLQADVTEITDAVGDSLAGLLVALQTGRATTAGVRTSIATMTAAAADLRAVRTTLDATDVEAEQVYDDAAVTLALWGWERGLRWSLASLDARITTGLAVGRELLSGRGETLHTVRLGETMQSIAARYLGDWRQWTTIAAVNGLDSSPVTVGTVLTIPQRV